MECATQRVETPLRCVSQATNTRLVRPRRPPTALHRVPYHNAPSNCLNA